MLKRIVSLLAAFASASAAIAGPVAHIPDKSERPLATPFDKGACEVEMLAGLFIGFNGSPSAKRPAIDFASQTLRAGWMLSTPGGSGFFRGNWELLLGAFGGEIYQGPGNFLAGGSLLLRYNFVQPGARFVPFLEGGLGILDNDIHHQQRQRLIGSGFEFDLQGLAGAHYFLTDAWAVTVEGGYRHISNANTASRNLGLNTLGGQIGVSYFFGGSARHAAR